MLAPHHANSSHWTDTCPTAWNKAPSCSQALSHGHSITCERVDEGTQTHRFRAATRYTYDPGTNPKFHHDVAADAVCTVPVTHVAHHQRTARPDNLIGDPPSPGADHDNDTTPGYGAEPTTPDGTPGTVAGDPITMSVTVPTTHSDPPRSVPRPDTQTPRNEPEVPRRRRRRRRLHRPVTDVAPPSEDRSTR